MPRFSRQEAINRLLPWVGKGVYGLGKGAKSLTATSPFQDGMCDCSEFVGYGFGFKPHEGDFPEYEGDINCDSALMDAGCIKGGKGKRKFFTPIVEAGAVEPGDILIFPSVRAEDVGDTSLAPSTRIRIGHTGVITGWKHHIPGEGDWSGSIADFSVIECSSGSPAVKHRWDVNFSTANVRRIVTWKGKHFAHEDWKTRIVRYVGP